MPIQELPRTAVRIGLNAARLPLTAAETVLSRRGDEEWPPTLAFEGFEASVKQVVGGLLRDEALVDEGRLTAAKVERLRQAQQLETVAEERRQRADAELAERRQADQRARRQADERAKARKAELAREKAADQRSAKAEAERKARAVREAEAAQEEVVARQARRTRSRTVSAKQAAVAKERAALKKAKAAEARQAEIEASKRASRS